VYNMINRVYCITFDYQHRNPTPDELDDYGTMSFWERMLKSYKDEDGFDVWPLGFRYAADIASVFGVSYLIYKAADVIMEKSTFRPKSLIPIICVDVARGLLPPLLAVSAAHAFDLFFARWSEISLGAAIYSSKGELLTNGDDKKILSKKAGRLAVKQTFEQRCFTVLCCLATGAVVNSILTHTIGVPKNPVLNAAISMFFLGFGLTAGVPLSLAMYDKKIYLKSTDLEDHFHHLIDENGEPELLYVYRGD